MRVIDLLQLLADTPRNAGVFFEAPTKPAPIADFSLTMTNEQPQLVLNLEHPRKQPLKQWEFSLLLNHKAYYQHYVYVQFEAQTYPLFGFRVADDRILLG